MSDQSAGGYHDSTEIADGASPSGGLRTRQGRFYYHGEPIYLLQTGTYGLRTDRGYDGRDAAYWRRFIDQLSALQSRGVRFRLRIDPWAFCYDADALSPWQRTGSGWDLGAFDDGFWTVLRDACAYAHSKDILVEVVLFNAATLRLGRSGTGWARNPFNSALGGPLTRDPAAAFYNLPAPDRYDLSTRAEGQGGDFRLQAMQEGFVREAAARLHGLDNVSWEIASQLEGTDPVRMAFLAHIVELLRQVDTLDRVATASVRTLRRADQDLYRLVGIDTVQFWLYGGAEPHEELFETVSALRSYGKPIVVGEAEWAPGEETWAARRALWQTYAAGGHACVDGLLSESAGAALTAFIGFVEHTGPCALIPDPKLVTSRTEGLHCHGGRSDERNFIVYVTAESPASDVEAAFRLSPGTWKATAVSPSTGDVLDEREIEAGRSAAQVPLPPFEDDLAVRLTRI